MVNKAPALVLTLAVAVLATVPASLAQSFFFPPVLPTPPASPPTSSALSPIATPVLPPPVTPRPPIFPPVFPSPTTPLVTPATTPAQTSAPSPANTGITGSPWPSVFAPAPSFWPVDSWEGSKSSHTSLIVGAVVAIADLGGRARVVADEEEKEDGRVLVL